MTMNKEPWERQLHQGLEQMERWTTPREVDIQAWEQLIVEEQSLQRRKLKRELTMFLIVAIVMLILVLLSFLRIPQVFVGMQVVALIGFPLLWLFRLRKKVTY
jgi:membrane-bound ClpP family serine protease